MEKNLIGFVSSDLKEKITNNHISNVTILNSSDLLISFSFYRVHKLLISTNHDSPYLGLVKIEDSFQTLNNDLSRNLRKELRNSYIMDVEQLNEDRIIKLTLSKLEDDFIRRNKFLILELIPHHPNLIVTDDNNVIKFATHYERNKSQRNIDKGSHYKCPTKHKTHGEKELVNLLEFYENIEKGFKRVVKKRISEKFAAFFTYLSNREKTLEKKKIIFSREIEEARGKLIYKEYGNFLLTIGDENLVDWKEKNRVYDESKTRIENAETCFRIYKKSKRQIEYQKNELDKISEEQSYLKHIWNQLEFASEEEVSEIENIVLGPKEKKKSKSDKKEGRTKFPYIEKEGTKIYYGKNDLQNDALTFKFANFKHTFLHIASTMGAHIIIAKENPTDDELLLGAELALLLTRKDFGEVNYALVKDLKKGHKPGLVIMKKHNTIYLKKIRNQTIDDLLQLKIINRRL